jgi:hypothetical protein
VPDPTLVQSLDRLPEGRLRERERDVVDAADVRRSSGRVGLALLVGEDGDEAPVSRIEVEMALGLVVEVGLLEDEGLPSTPSQKSMDVCRLAPTSVMWWTPWLWSFRTGPT